MVRIQCPKCGSKKVYLLGIGKRRCARCRYDFTPHRLPLYLTRDQWRDLITWFLLEQSSQNIALKKGIERRRVMRALTIVRWVLTRDIPDIFTGTVEVDETYLGGQWRNKRKIIRDTGTKRGRGTRKQPVFGILCRDDQVWAEIVDKVDEGTLLLLITKRVEPGSTVCSNTWKAYTGIAARGYVHSLVHHGEGTYSDGKGNHINGLEGFWGYLKRKLASKGGISRRKMPLYLAEYVWRYNHRADPERIKLRRIIRLLEQS